MAADIWTTHTAMAESTRNDLGGWGWAVFASRPNTAEVIQIDAPLNPVATTTTSITQQMERQKTPPHKPRADPLTPEQLRKIEINRLKAKARLRATEEARLNKDSPASLRNANNKRPLTVVPANDTSPTVNASVASGSSAGSKGKADANAPLKRDERLMGRYLDYDLSKMVDSRGGFLIEDRAGVDESERKRLLARERERMKQNMDPRKFQVSAEGTGGQ